MGLDILFVLRPGFSDRGERWFCPHSAQVIGFLSYYPSVRDTVELREISFARPRREVVDLVGERYQAVPLLVLTEDLEPPAVGEVTMAESRGRRLVEKTIDILRYLAATRGVPGPH